MANQATITAVEMGAITVTAKLIQNAKNVVFNLDRQILKVTRSDGFVEEFDISAATTVSCTVSGGTFAFTVS